MKTINTAEDVLKQIRHAADNAQHVKLPDNKQFLMDSGTASLILQFEKKLDKPEVREKFERMITNHKGLMQLVSFLWKNSSFN